jgi:RNA polymerase sigma-70 factor (ECF subfamily)
MDPTSDEALMLAYAKGSQSAFAQLYERHRGSLFRYLLRLVRQPAVAEDLFQETWNRLIQARARYAPTAKFSSWLFQIAHRLALDWLRRDPQHKSDSLEDRVVELPSACELAPDAVLLSEEGRERLMAAIDRLPTEQRAALLLQAEANLSLDEIAKLQDTGRETVKSRLRYALAKLKEALRS